MFQIMFDLQMTFSSENYRFNATNYPQHCMFNEFNHKNRNFVYFILLEFQIESLRFYSNLN